MLTLTELRGELATPKQIVVTTHYKPDGDALGSSLALFHWLRAKGHAVSLIVPSDYPAFLNWLPGQEVIQVFTQQQEAANKLIQQANIIFCLDFNGLARIHTMEHAVREAKGTKVMIDHHLEPEGFDDIRLWDPTAAATAQLIFEFLANHMDARDMITSDMATCMYTGIMTDTGSFRFRSTTAAVHLITADLITLGAENWKIHDFIYNSSTESRLKFIGHCLLNRLEVLPEYNTALFTITREDLQKFSITTGDTEGLVNYALSIVNIRLAGLFVDRTDLVKLSLRSIENIPCNEICREYFNGGGHLNAAGGFSSESLHATVEKFKGILPNYKQQLTT
ncbi:phosphoesterase RecJ domain-containing protein [bacterium A37T11]|nr:phosphoesterase RecJ domain-containing protein [bacterium A37T11]